MMQINLTAPLKCLKVDKLRSTMNFKESSRALETHIKAFSYL